MMILFTSQPSAAGTAPPEFQDLYTALSGDLSSFNTTLNSIWNGTKYPVLFAGTLKSADANAGPMLGDSDEYPGIDLQLQELKAMGVQAIMVAVGFPMLYEPFFDSHAQYQQFVDLYAHVAADVRAAGLKLIVENNNLLSDDVQAGWNTAPFFAGLNWDQYQAARAQTAVVVAQTMRPDYMVVLQEPDMEASQTGQPQANTVDGSVSMLSQILAALQQAGITGVKIGAGVGTWHPDYLQFTQNFVAMPLDFIDMHIYPVNNSYLANALTMASVAAAAGKPVAMTEAWMWKIRDSELGILTPAEVRARNSYSFWAPLDASALQTFQNLGYYTKMAFLAPSGPEYLFAYQEYDDVKSLPPGQVVNQQMAASAVANQQAAYTSSGLSFYNSLVSPPDTTPPAMPANVTGVSGAPNQASVSWDASGDDIGVAGYSVFRDGVKIANTGFAYYQDSGLTGSKTYTYTISAFDLGGNVSSPSLPVSVTTKDVVAPGAPANPAATVVSCQQIKMTWSPAIDDVGVGSYRVFRGASPAALVQVGSTYGTTTSFTHYPLTPDTTYYFGVQAVDSSGNVSPMSAIVSAATPALPSAPAGVAAAAVSTRQINVSWLPGPSGMPIGSYRIFRGSAPANLAQVAVRAASPYSDTSLTPGTTYCYGVQQVDTGGNVSPMSATVCAATLALPSAPTGVTAGALSTKQIALAWQPGPSGMPVASYRVFRGSAPSNLSQLASVKTTSYTNSNLTPGTTYYYAVQEVDTGGNVSPMSPTVPGTTLKGPSAPTGLTATPVSTKQINLAWTASTGGAAITGYNVFRGTSASNLTKIAATAKTTFSSTSLTPGTTYYFAVQATDAENNVSPMSNTVAAATSALPSPPASVTATAISRTQVSLTWTAAQSGMPLASYRIYRGASPSTLVQIRTVAATQTSATDYPVTAGTTYYYALQSADTGGNLSALSGVAQVTTPN